MAGVVEVHDRMVAQLHQRNIQLQQEKAECELKLRQATALLSEMQAAWMDLPPKVAHSIEKLLASQGQGRQSQGPATPLSGGPLPMGGAGAGQGTGSPNRKSDKRSQGWLSFSLDELFGCTAPRTPRLLLGADAMAAAAKQQDSADKADKSFREDIARIDSSDKAAGGASPWPRHECSETPCTTPRLPGSPCRSTQTMHIELLHNGSEIGTSPLDVGDLLCDTPGATSLVAEIDMLCCALKAESERTRRDAERALEEVREEGRQLRQRLEDSFRCTTAAQEAELELCRAQLAELASSCNPCFALERGLLPEPCDSDWAHCRRAAELRAKAGQAHVNWLEECLSQRLSATRSLIAARQRDFSRDLETIWERKAKLVARLRGRLHAASEAEAAADHAAGVNRELVHLRRALADLESSALVPLRELSAGQGRDSGTDVQRLQGAVGEARSQSKAALAHLAGLAERCRAELGARLSDANAAHFAQGRLQRKRILGEAFSLWTRQRLADHLAGARSELSARRVESDDLRAQLAALADARCRAERRLQRAAAGREEATRLLAGRPAGRPRLAACFTGWWAQALEAQLDAVKRELARNYEETAAYCSRLGCLETEHAAKSSQDCRAQRVLAALALSDKLPSTNRQVLLACVLREWVARMLESRLASRTSELDSHRAAVAELSAHLDAAETGILLVRSRLLRRALLAAALRDWVEYWLRQVIRQHAEEMEAQQANEGMRFAELRTEMLQLIDSFAAASSPAFETTSAVGSGTGVSRQNRRLHIAMGAAANWDEATCWDPAPVSTRSTWVDSARRGSCCKPESESGRTYSLASVESS